MIGKPTRRCFLARPEVMEEIVRNLRIYFPEIFETSEVETSEGRALGTIFYTANGADNERVQWFCRGINNAITR